MARRVQEIVLALFAIVTVLAIGTFGYAYIENWPLFDALYMTVITLTTVGYAEVHSLTLNGRIFTIILILSGVGVAMFVLTAFARAIFEQQVFWIFERRNMQKEISKLSQHTIFCGYSRLSSIAICQLHEQGVPLVIIDYDEEKVAQAIAAGYHALQGDATQESVLLEAGIERAERLVSILPKDADNLYVILTAREVQPAIYIISRAEDESSEKRMRKAGADRLISPYRVGGQWIADGVIRPHVTEFLDVASPSGASDLAIEQVVVPERSSLVNKTLAESGLRADRNIIVAAIRSADGQMHFNPSGDTKILAGSTLIALGMKQDFGELERVLLG